MVLNLLFPFVPVILQFRNSCEEKAATKSLKMRSSRSTARFLESSITGHNSGGNSCDIVSRALRISCPNVEVGKNSSLNNSFSNDCRMDELDV